MDPNETEVLIPGNFIARIYNGRIIGYVFTPHAAHAGNFEDEIVVISGDTTLDSDTFFNLVGDSLMFDQNKESAFFSCEWLT